MKLGEKLKNTNFNFARNGRWFFVAPAIILLIGIIFLATMGFNLGLEFTGGTIVSVSADGEHTKAEIETKMDTYNVKYTITEEQSTSGGTKYSIKFNANETEVENMIADLKEFFNDDDWHKAESIQATTTQETVLRVFWSILAALAGLIVYMLIRFKFTAGMATILALAHDVLMICSLMSIFRIEINASFIAAILTVMAYSINNIDTYNREVNNLIEFARHSDRDNKLVIVTYEEEKTIRNDEKTIEVIPLNKFLLDN